jgi:8-amino-7-oxononanoate synthase
MKEPADQEARERLFSRVRSMEPELSQLPKAARTENRNETDFRTLPGYDEFQMQRELGRKLGIENPYFRLHDSRSGTHADIGGRKLLNFSSYDYLSMNGHPEIVETAKAAVEQFGVSASGSRPISGERPVHRELEKALAEHYGVEQCVTFVSGYATNVGVIGQLLGQKDILLYDSAIHNSIVVGGILSNAARRSYRHNDLDNLEEILMAHRGSYERAMIVVEGLYGMDGDIADLPRLIEIKKRYRAWLMVDEAHSLGTIGKRGMGSAEHFGVDPKDVDIWMGTLSKTLCACGGYIAGSADLIEYVKLTAGSFVYSVAMPPVIAAAALKALEIFHREPERVTKLQENASLFLKLCREQGLDTGTAAGTAVATVMTHDSLPAAMLSQKLFERGINTQPIMYPGVPAKASRLRFFINSAHSESNIRTAAGIIAEEWKRISDMLSAMQNPAKT